ncbi:MAG: hypothetical protein WCF16_13455, partial [Alphaproteobacteria bacterium]
MAASSEYPVTTGADSAALPAGGAAAVTAGFDAGGSVVMGVTKDGAGLDADSSAWACRRAGAGACADLAATFLGPRGRAAGASVVV